MRTVRSSGRILWRGVSGPWGGAVCSMGGVCSGGGCGIPACTEAETPTPLCKNITFATSLRTVKILAETLY